MLMVRGQNSCGIATDAAFPGCINSLTVNHLLSVPVPCAC